MQPFQWAVACGSSAVLAMLLSLGVVRAIAALRRARTRGAPWRSSPVEAPSGEDAEILGAAQKVLDDSRLAIARPVIVGVTIGYACRVLPLFGELWLGQSPSTDFGLFGYFVGLVVSTTATFCIDRITKPVAIGVTLALMWSFSVMACPLGVDSAAGATMVVIRPALTTGVSFVPLIYLRFRLFLATTTVFQVCIAWLVFDAPSEIVGEVPKRIVLSTDFAWFAARLCLAWAVESWLERLAVREVRARNDQCQRSTVSELLRMSCDAIVETDTGLLLKSEAPSLGSLLMHDTNKRLLGEPFTSFVVDEGGDFDFEANIARNVAGRDGVPTPGMFGGHLRDTCGNHVAVTLFHMPYQTIGGNLHHMIGIREEERAPEVTETQPELPPAVLRPSISRALRRRSSARRRPDIAVDVLREDGLPIVWASVPFMEAFQLPRSAAPGSRRLAEFMPLAAPVLKAWIEEKAASTNSAGVQDLGELGELAAPPQLGEKRWAIAFFPTAPVEASAGPRCISLGFREVLPESRTTPSWLGTPASHEALALVPAAEAPSVASAGPVKMRL